MFNNFFNKKKILVTGNTGFKGSWLSIWLKNLGADVVGLSISIPTTPSHFELCGLDNKMKTHFIDIRNAEVVQKVFNDESPEIVFHLAAEALVGECFNNPVKAFETNSLGTLNILESIRLNPTVKTAVIITSDKCYENIEINTGYRENDRLGGKDPYSASKACAEIIFSSYFRSYFKNSKTLKIATARAGNVIGGGDWANFRVVPDCFKAFAKNEKVILRNPEATRPWQHVLEPLSGYLWLACQLDRGIGNGESYNFGPDFKPHSVEELVAALKIDFEVVKNNNFNEATLLQLNCDKALKELTWQPALNFEQTVNLTAEWYKDFYLNHKKEMANFSSEQIEQYIAIAKNRKLSWVTK